MEEIPNLRELKLEMFEMEDPKRAEKLKKRIAEKMEETEKEIKSIIEEELSSFFKEKEKNKPKISYIG